MKVSELTVEEFKILMENTIAEKFEELLGDPDEDLELRSKVRDRLQVSLARTKRGERDIPVEQVAEEVGLRWRKVTS